MKSSLCFCRCARYFSSYIFAKESHSIKNKLFGEGNLGDFVLLELSFTSLGVGWIPSSTSADRMSMKELHPPDIGVEEKFVRGSNRTEES